MHNKLKNGSQQRWQGQSEWMTNNAGITFPHVQILRLDTSNAGIT